MAFSASLTSETGPAQTASNRAEVRKRCFMAATISFNKGLTSCECVIRNLSESGARLDVASPVSLPTFFHLYIPAQQKQLFVELKWRSESEVGIEFCDEGLGATTALEHRDQSSASLRHRIRELEAEVGRLQNRIIQLTEGAI